MLYVIAKRILYKKNVFFVTQFEVTSTYFYVSKRAQFRSLVGRPMKWIRGRACLIQFEILAMLALRSHVLLFLLVIEGGLIFFGPPISMAC